MALNSALARNTGPATVINAIPRTNQTDPSKFPTYEYRPYPCMVKNKKDGKPYIDKETNQIAYVNDEDEEREYLAAHTDAMIKRGSEGVSAEAFDAQADENAKLKARIVELEAVQGAKPTPVAAVAPTNALAVVTNKKPGRPKLTAEEKLQAKLTATQKEIEKLKAKSTKAAPKQTIAPVIPLRGGQTEPQDMTDPE